ncbi:28S ribosomal protein S9, mitochondrial-like isoform X1 [Varroa jacobsoni]|uniref:28S ribosomal protein S9, mitochondrial-like isoform X1 n=1 Tax=Varroa jacobsoni TaxID=62625 RepID=UPI000BF8094A|nr:28S ribosomal protein S9, mitochondrial-like isoform X1 [Varroa jacobsoni]
MLLNRIVPARKLARGGVSTWVNNVACLASRTIQTGPSSSLPVDSSDGKPNLEVLQPLKRGITKVQKISRAMQVYLDRARKHEDFLKKQGEEFDLGKRHLANMMGWDPDNITQEDIDKAIAYLLPSGLYEPRARPMMKPPEDVFPREKAAEFDYSGRPFNYLFYTGKANFYCLLHDAVAELNKLNKREVRMVQLGYRYASEKCQMSSRGTRWVTKAELEELLVETLTGENYEYFVRTMTRLMEHPYSLEAQEFLSNLRRSQVSSVAQQVIEPVKHDEQGNPYVEARGTRKSAIAKVVVYGNGTGRVMVNGLSINEYFAEIKDRIQIMFPLQFAGLLNKVDVNATIFLKKSEYVEGEKAQLTEQELQKLRKPVRLGEGSMAEAGAIRLAIARALCSFVSEQETETMRLAGLLTQDPRIRERKKPGQMGARRKYTWLKR